MAAEEAEAVGMRATVERQTFREFLEPANQITTEAKVIVSDGRIEYAAADPANVAIASATLTESAFDSFDARECAFGADFTRLARVCEHLRGDRITLTLDTEFRKLTLATDNREYTYCYIDPEAVRQEAEIPTLDGLSTEVTIHGEALADAVAYISAFSEHADVGYDHSAGEFAIRGEGETDSLEVVFDRDDLRGVQSSGDAHSRFYVNYFTDIAEVLPDDRAVTVSVGREFPMRIDYALGGSDAPATHYGEATLLQAPRIVGGDD
jgi:proliferating cell nuclear antigen